MFYRRIGRPAERSVHRGHRGVLLFYDHVGRLAELCGRDVRLKHIRFRARADGVPRLGRANKVGQHMFVLLDDCEGVTQIRQIVICGLDVVYNRKSYCVQGDRAASA